MEWIACQVVNGKEYDIRKKILNADPSAQIEILRKYSKEMKAGVVKTKSEKMLPGYVLIGTENPINTSILKGFLKLIGKVSQDEFDRLKAQEGQKEAIIEDGSKIIVIDGPFQGTKGNVLRMNKDGSLACRLIFQGMEINTKMNKELLSTIN